jgi:endogenous inhibitor of DNA gyrase (YacG/DUF329 family)
MTARCPNCGKRTVIGAENPWRPFCSERCRLIDLGAWIDGSHRLPAEEPAPPHDVTTPAANDDH